MNPFAIEKIANKFYISVLRSTPSWDMWEVRYVAESDTPVSKNNLKSAWGFDSYLAAKNEYDKLLLRCNIKQ